MHPERMEQRMFDLRRKISDLTPELEERNARSFREIEARAKQLIQKAKRSQQKNKTPITYLRLRSGGTAPVQHTWPIVTHTGQVYHLTDTNQVVSVKSGQQSMTHVGTLREFILTLPFQIQPSAILQSLVRQLTSIKN